MAPRLRAGARGLLGRVVLVCAKRTGGPAGVALLTHARPGIRTAAWALLQCFIGARSTSGGCSTRSPRCFAPAPRRCWRSSRQTHVRSCAAAHAPDALPVLAHGTPQPCPAASCGRRVIAVCTAAPGAVPAQMAAAPSPRTCAAAPSRARRAPPARWRRRCSRPRRRRPRTARRRRRHTSTCPPPGCGPRWARPTWATWWSRCPAGKRTAPGTCAGACRVRGRARQSPPFSSRVGPPSKRLLLEQESTGPPFLLLLRLQAAVAAAGAGGGGHGAGGAPPRVPQRAAARGGAPRRARRAAGQWRRRRGPRVVRPPGGAASAAAGRRAQRPRAGAGAAAAPRRRRRRRRGAGHGPARPPGACPCVLNRR